MAVLEPNAPVARTLGGGSATAFPPYTIPWHVLAATLTPVRILADAWIGVIWRIWQDHTSYDPAKHGGAVRRLTA